MPDKDTLAGKVSFAEAYVGKLTISGAPYEHSGGVAGFTLHGRQSRPATEGTGFVGKELDFSDGDLPEEELCLSDEALPSDLQQPIGQSLDELLLTVRSAPFDSVIELERQGVPAAVVKELAARMGIPAMRFYQYIGIPRATAEKKAAKSEPLAGAPGHAILGLMRLLDQVQAMLPKDTNFNVAGWLGQWFKRPQPALGGQPAAAYLDTPTGLERVSRLLGAMESGAFQ